MLSSLAMELYKSILNEGKAADPARARECIDNLLVMAASFELCDPLTNVEEFDRNNSPAHLIVLLLSHWTPNSRTKEEITSFVARIKACPSGYYKSLILDKIEPLVSEM